MATMKPTMNAGTFDEERQCWEGGSHVPTLQQRHSLGTLEAVLCHVCEAWAVSVLITAKED
jgi:hypothetical protein